MRLRDRFPVIGGLLSTAGRVVLGDRPVPAGVPLGFQAFFLLVARKATVAAVGGLIAWSHRQLGWDLVSFFGEGFEAGLIEAITAYLVYRIGNGTPQPR